jgi:tetraacyldisaccharide 4'-kinase
LLPLSLIYFIIILIRKYFLTYILSRYTSSINLIIIGNLNIGGSGKTPFTIWLANYLYTKEKRIGIISSGYKSNVTIPKQINSSSKANEVGDEALLLQSKTEAVVVSSDNRVNSTKFLKDKTLDYIIHDDGLQHYQLNRDYEFIITKYKSSNDNLLLPCGPLREPKFFHPNAIFIYSNYYGEMHPGFYTKLSQIRSPYDSQLYLLNDSRFSKSYLLTAIADDTDLKEELRGYHAGIMCVSFVDHHQFVPTDIPDTTEPILVTEKDFTKLKEFKVKNIYILEQSLVPNAKLTKIIENF